MALDDDIAVLAAAPLFGHVPHDALRLICFAADARRLARDEVLFQRGDKGDGGYVVLRGAILLEARGTGDAPVVAGPASLIGQIALFVREERPTTARATEPTEVIRISPTLMRRVLEEFPDAALAIRDVVAADLSGLTDGLGRIGAKLLAIAQPPSKPT